MSAETSVWNGTLALAAGYGLNRRKLQVGAKG
jgi:hypothetical protein